LLVHNLAAEPARDAELRSDLGLLLALGDPSSQVVDLFPRHQLRVRLVLWSIQLLVCGDERLLQVLLEPRLEPFLRAGLF